MDIRFFGIRHHGPGSARNLLDALAHFRPDILLIELPADAGEVLEWVTHRKMVPPVALLIYHPKDLQQAAYLPFAEFSPEWQALRFARKAGIPIEPMDLPVAHQLALRETDQSPEIFLADPDSPEKGLRIQTDPLGFLAELSGYTDSECWWEHTFERSDQPGTIFEAIGEMMRALRQELGREESRETLLREAWMRKTLRAVIGRKQDRIAVVCGAWHVPAIEDWESIPPKRDQAALKGLKKIKTEATWVPWAYNRLARTEGYGAGVVSPAWYELLFQDPSRSHLVWVSRAARLLRAEDLSASAAHSVEAARLAYTLAGMRGFSNPGLDELQEAARAVFTHGQDYPLELIRDRLVIGDRLGKIPSDLPRVPLQRDMDKQVRSARLSREYQTTVALTKELDLRKAANRKASILLHRLSLLGIPWGELRAGSPEQQGSFREVWRLKWKAEFAIRLIEAGMWGNTVEEATTRFVCQSAAEAESLQAVTEKLYRVLPADLPDALQQLLEVAENRAALSQNIRELIEALPVLVQILRYGDVRETDTRAVNDMLKHLFPRVFVGLPGLVSQIEESFARELFPWLIKLNHSIGLLRWTETDQDWSAVLKRLQGHSSVNPLIRGMASRLLLDKSRLTVPEAARALRFALSDQGSAPAWLEGFLFGSGLLLIRQPELWRILNDWVGDLQEDRFLELLPVLRRTFANFTVSERQQMLHRAAQGDQSRAFESEDWDPELLSLVLPALCKQL